jgi:Peptidase family M28
MMDLNLVPAEEQIYGWIEEVFRQGVRRPGYPADRWTENWVQEKFHSFGLERVNAEPVETPYWEPLESSLLVMRADGTKVDLPCFALPFSLPDEVEAPLVLVGREDVHGSIAMSDLKLLSVPHSWYGRIATWQFDPDDSFAGASHLLPFALGVQEVMEPAIHAGASGFIGVLSGYPGNSLDYYVPYDAKWRSIPGVWIRGSDGEYLKSLLTMGSVCARIKVAARREMTMSFNIVGELPGADDEIVIIGSHHDGPWSSAVEDGSGISLVLAQAAYWSRVPQSDRPHRLQFLLNCGHMSGGAGQSAFVRTHWGELDRVVLELHLEHAAVEVAEAGGECHPTGRPEPRWWFTSRIARLEAAVREAIEAEDLRRSYILPPTAFGEKPTTDAADFHLAGVPLVNYLTAPFYLFDAMDTLDKIHRSSLVPITRAAIRIVNSTAGVSAAAMRTTQT